MSLPHAIHQLWIGPSPIPDRERKWSEQMAAMNTGWKHYLHGNEILERYVADPYVAALRAKCGEDKKNYAFLCDRLRILLLRDEGGVYIDVDSQPISPLNSLTVWDSPSVEFVYGMRSPHRRDVALHRGVPLVDNTFLASSKNSRMVNRIAALWSPRSVFITGADTGICILENQGPDTVCLNQRYFYAEQRYPETIALHDSHNLGSWTTKTTPPRFANEPHQTRA